MNVSMTLSGYKKLCNEIDNLTKVERPAISERIALARESDSGELSENTEYQQALEQQGLVEAKIVKLNDLKFRTIVVDITKIPKDKIFFGATVTIVNEDTDEEYTYQLVSEYESDISNGLISNKSPLGAALLRHEVGDTVTVIAPKGDVYYEILSIEYNE